VRLLRDYSKIRRSLVAYLADLAREYGDVVHLPLRRPTYMLRDPADIKRVLVSNYANYHKTGGLRVGKELFGDGLVTSEIPLHPRQRRLIQPLFQRRTIAGFAELMTRSARRRTDGWPHGGTIELGQEMMQVTLAIVGQVLFGADLTRDAQHIGNAFLRSQVEITRAQHGLPVPRVFRSPGRRRFRRAVRSIDDYVFGLIADRRSRSSASRDLLALLLESRGEDGRPMDERLVRDETVTALMAGHETVSNGLVWTFYLLARHPEVERRVVDELDRVLGGRSPTADDLPSMTYTEMVFAESLRLYPPAWTLARRALQPDVLPGGLPLSAGDEVILPQYVCHRNPKYFPDPERFDPQRFDPEAGKDRPQFAYFPFGGGPRYCVGEPFARLEASLLIAAILQQHALELVPGQDIVPQALISMRPRNGIRMRVRRR
jgi:cytochrome P450